MEIVRNYEAEIAALELQKQALMREQEVRTLQLLEQIQMADAQKRIEKLTRLIDSGVRLGMAISKPEHEGKWIDITDAALKLVANLQ